MQPNFSYGQAIPRVLRKFTRKKSENMKMNLNIGLEYGEFWRRQPLQQMKKMSISNKIREAFMDTSGSDRIHAAETMAKLRYAPPIQDSLATKAALLSSVKPLAWYTQWSVAYTSD